MLATSTNKYWAAFQCLAWISTSFAQLESSRPFPYPGIPSGPYSSDWQTYYEVKELLPNITWKLPRSYAGTVSVNRKDHEDNSLFFIAYEKEDKSLSAKKGEREKEPWTIWLNGGPGSSSLIGLFKENGPIRFTGNTEYNPNGTNVEENPESWHKLSDIFFVDQPVGVGYSTVDSTGYVSDEEDIGEDFVQFLTNLVEIFPSLKQRPLYLTGESYAGTYIPYIAKTIFSKPSPPVNLVKLAIGDGLIGRYSIASNVGVLNLIHTYPQLINFSPNVYDYFEEQYNLCGYNFTVSYPETTPYPPLDPDPFDVSSGKSDLIKRGLHTDSPLQNLIRSWKTSEPKDLDRIKRQVPRADLPFPPLTGTLDPWYGCSLFAELEDWALNYTLPWLAVQDFDYYQISNALHPEPPADPSPYLNDPLVQAALHAPKKLFSRRMRYPWGNKRNGDDLSLEPQVILSDLMKNVSIVFYSGNDDGVLSHRGTEVAIQNSTFGGIQGFTKKPSTPWKDDDGNFAGIVHQERNVTYALFYGAGHMVPMNKPKSATRFFRDFILGSDTTGLVLPNGDTVGGEDAKYVEGVLTVSEVFTGEYTTEATVTWATDIWKSWDSYLATRTKDNISTST